MSRSVASGWIGRLFLRRLRCACWGMASKRVTWICGKNKDEEYLKDEEE